VERSKPISSLTLRSLKFLLPPFFVWDDIKRSYSSLSAKGNNQVFFAWLSPVTNADLAKAVLKIGLCAEYPSGQSDEPETYTIPSNAMTFNDNSHLAVRDAEVRNE
jgi:hypothetical protein